MTSMESLVTSDPERMGGTPVFAGTRVPVRTLFDHLTEGDSLDHFDSVTREQAVAVLESSMNLLIAEAHKIQ